MRCSALCAAPDGTAGRTTEHAQSHVRSYITAHTVCLHTYHVRVMALARHLAAVRGDSSKRFSNAEVSSPPTRSSTHAGSLTFVVTRLQVESFSGDEIGTTPVLY